MKAVTLFFCSLLMCQVAIAEFHDPMQPPPYAINKFRLQKMKNSQPKKAVVKKQQNANPWILSSILYSGQREHAIINNQLVRPGDVIKGARLVRMSPTSARLNAKGKIINLSLRNKSDSIKKSPSERKL